MELVYLLTGLLIGAITAWFLAKFKYTADRNRFTQEEVTDKFILKEVHEALQNQADILKADLNEKEKELRDLGSQLSAKDQEGQNLQS